MKETRKKPDNISFLRQGKAARFSISYFRIGISDTEVAIINLDRTAEKQGKIKK